MTEQRRRAAPVDDAQSTVELALLLPVVVLLLLAVLQVGLAARDVVLVTHASREAARAAAVDRSPGAARAAAVASSGLRGDRLEVTVSGGSRPGGRVRVVVTYRSPTDVPIIGALLGDRTIRSEATMRVEAPAQHAPRRCTNRASRPHSDRLVADLASEACRLGGSAVGRGEPHRDRGE